METENIEQTADDLPKEVVDYICKEETKVRRKANWEKFFERVSILSILSTKKFIETDRQIIDLVPKIDVDIT